MPWSDPLLAAGAAALFLLALLGAAWAWRRHRGRVPPAAAPGRSWLLGLAKTRGHLGQRLLRSWSGTGASDAWVAEIESVLLGADVGVTTTRTLLEAWGSRLAAATSPEQARALLREALRATLGDPTPVMPGGPPHVILIVGVNGVGKTTTIGKLAHRYRRQGKRVLLVAADTFRAAAIEQLSHWAARAGAELVKHQHGADPSAVAFDGVTAAQARGIDVVIVDTAGRLHVKANLMEELKKIARTIGRQVPGAPHEALLVIDATTGQNALHQARLFREAVALTGVVLAKLDGTAKGGVALAIRQEIGLPIRYAGLGEGLDDLVPFDPDAFLDALFAADP
jgi:fused signal recognition particle receptor